MSCIKGSKQTQEWIAKRAEANKGKIRTADSFN
jgi:hypothetical protein